MNTQGEIEAAGSGVVSRFEQEYMGRGRKEIRADPLGELLVVRLQAVLTSAEQRLVKSLPAGGTCSSRFGPGWSRSPLRSCPT